jgi:hypothetical protein
MTGDDDEKEDKVADVKTNVTESGTHEATVTRESGKTGSGIGMFTEQRAIDNAVSDSE